MKMRLSWCVLALFFASTAVFAQEPDEAPAPPPADEPREERPEDRPPPPDESPSDQPPELNGRDTRGYAPGKQAPFQGPQQAPGKQAPFQGPAQGPGKQAPMQQAPMQAPNKAAYGYGGGQMHTMGYAGDYNCAGCGPTYQQPVSYGGGCCDDGRHHHRRRGLFHRRRGC